MRMITFLAGMAAGALLARPYSRSDGGRGWGRGRSSTLSGATADRRPMGMLESDQPTHAAARTDDQVRQRVLGQIGRTIHNPQAVEVLVQDGCVTLCGQLQARDAVLLMAEVENTAGVTAVRNELVLQGSLDDIAPPPMRDRPAVRAGEEASSRMS